MKVAVIMGSTSDLPKVEPAIQILKDYGVEVQVRCLSAHRAHVGLSEFMKEIKDLPSRSLAQDAFIASSKDFAKRSVCTYNLALKKIRPAAPFIIAGAVTGLLTSFVSNVLRTDVN